MKVAFYDDNLQYIRAFRTKFPHVKSFHVTNKQPNPILKGNAPFYYPLLFSQLYKHNAYAKMMVSDLAPQKTPPLGLCHYACEMPSFGSGMTIPEIKAAARRDADVVLFDWDLTLSTCSGLVLAEGPLDYSYAEIAQFYTGTLERFNALRAMFTELRRKGVRVYIFTDNGWGQPKKPDADAVPSGVDRFVKVLEQLDGQITAADVVYGNKDKVKTFQTNPLFSAFCKPRCSRKARKPKRATKKR
jgi:hypothetical protein